MLIVLIVCFGISPGVGVTTPAVNLSVAFSLSRRAETPLVELRPKPDNLLSALGLAATAPYGDLAATGRVLKWDTLCLHLVGHSTGVRVLPAPPLDSAVPLVLTRRAIAILRARFPLVLADAKSEADPRFRSALLAADAVLLVLSPEVSTIRSSLTATHELRALEVPERQILLVVNKVRPKASVPVQRIRERMKRPILGVIPHEPATEAVLDMGKPLVFAQPTSPASLAIGRTAMQLGRGLS